MKSEYIDSFTEEYRFLSNFYPSFVVFEDRSYPTVENAYQAAKTSDTVLRVPFFQYTPGQAKRAGKELELREDWELVKLSVMENLLREKFKDPKLAGLLLATGDAKLIEGNTWGDKFWGCVQTDSDDFRAPKHLLWSGENHLGKLLMKIRDELKEANKLPEKRKLTIEFDNQDALEHFVGWLSGSHAESDYQMWMECRESERKNKDKDITVLNFKYYEEDERFATDDRRRYGKYLKDNTIKTVCGRMDAKEE